MTVIRTEVDPPKLMAAIITIHQIIFTTTVREEEGRGLVCKT